MGMEAAMVFVLGVFCGIAVAYVAPLLAEWGDRRDERDLVASVDDAITRARKREARRAGGYMN